MVELLPMCGNCRRPNVGHVSVVRDIDDEEFELTMVTGTNVLCTDALNAQLNEYRNERRDINTHHEGSLLWEELPFPIDVRTWTNYWTMLTPIWIERCMYKEWWCYQWMSCAVGEWLCTCYWYITHRLRFFYLIDSMRFRLFFWKDDSATSVEIRRLTLLPHSGGPSVYPEDNEWVRDLSR